MGFCSLLFITALQSVVVSVPRAQLNQASLDTKPDSLTQPVAKTLFLGGGSHRLAAGTLEAHSYSVSMAQALTY